MSDLSGVFDSEDGGQAALAESFSEGFQALPPGKHKVTIIKAELKDTKAGNMGLSMGYETEDGNKVSGWVNLTHGNPKVVTIGKKELAKIATVAGVSELKQTEQLLGLPLVIRVTQIEEEYNGKMYKKNNIKGYYPASEPCDTAPVAAPVATQTAW